MCKLLSGMRVEADALFDEQLIQTDFDAIVMPGGLAGVTTFTDNPLLIETVRNYLKD